MVETRFQTSSFIPKQPVTEEGPRHASGAGILFLIGFLMLIISAAGAAGVFIWNKTILSNIEKGEANLKESKKGFDNNTIASYTKLDNRIDVADMLLKKHVKASALFSKLGLHTLQTVRFSNFTYSLAPNGAITINMAGEASDYESMALQAKQFTSNQAEDAFKSPIFSDFNKVKDRVVFTFKSGVNPYVIDYYKARMSELEAGGVSIDMSSTSKPSTVNTDTKTQPAPVDQSGATNNTRRN